MIDESPWSLPLANKDLSLFGNDKTHNEQILPECPMKHINRVLPLRIPILVFLLIDQISIFPSLDPVMITSAETAHMQSRISKCKVLIF
jgi:hypothetical protein